MKKGNGQNQSLTNFFKVKQRTKKDPITIEGYLGIEEGYFIKGEQGFKKIMRTPEEKHDDRVEKIKEDKKKFIDGVYLKITVNPNDWEKLWSYCLCNQKEFAKHFWSDIIYPAMKDIETKKGARGRYKDSKHFVNWLKTDASFLYVYFNYWNRKPIDKWPDYLQKLLNKIREDEGYNFYVFGEKVKGFFNATRGTTRPYRLTRYCIEKVHGNLLKKYNLKPFDDPRNFLETYIYENGRAARIKKFFIEGKTSQEIEQLAHEASPLKFILESLQII